MFEKLGIFIVKRRKVVLVLFLLATLLAGGVGSQAFGKLDTGGYSDENSESAKAFSYLVEKFKVEEPAAILVVDSETKSDTEAELALIFELNEEVKANEAVKAGLVLVNMEPVTYEAVCAVVIKLAVEAKDALTACKTYDAV